MGDVPGMTPEDRALWDALGDSKPRFTVWPTPGATHELQAVRMAASLVGQSLLPWQAWVTRTLTEHRADGGYRFPDYLLTVPRQAGKTTLIRSVLLSRMMTRKNRQAFYTAQTRMSASDRWRELGEAVTTSAFANEFKFFKGVGHERLVFNRTGSKVSPFAPSAESLHGYTPHDVAMDEIFSLDTFRGNDLLGAIKPAQQTILDRQLIMLSTAGHAGSTFLRERVDLGRAATEGSGSTGYVEWSLHEDADPYDESNWSFHPSLGHLVTIESLREMSSTLTKGEWQRAFMNQWVEAVSPIFDMEAYRALAGDLRRVERSEVVLGVSSAADRSRAVVVAAWWQGERIAVKLVQSTRDVGKFPTLVSELVESRPIAVAADPGGLDKHLVDEVRQALPDWRQGDFASLSPSDWAIASLDLAACIADGELIHDGDDALAAGLAGATSKRLSETWALSHKSPPEVIAMAAAVRVLKTKPRRQTTMEVITYDGIS